jgi:Site-specific recombinase XerD
MLLTVFRPSARKGRSASRLYRGRYRFDDMPRPVEIPLKTADEITARKRLQDHVNDLQRAKEGLAPLRPMRAALSAPFADVLNDYRLDLIAQGRNRQHVKDSCRRIERIARECRWSAIGDANAATFTKWRAKVAPSLSAKYLKEYGVSLRAFFAWLIQTERYDRNPFALVRHPQVRGRETRVRRAFTVEEARRLLAVADYHRLPYLLLFYTGLRYKAAWALRWCDYHTDREGGGPRFVLPASRDKSRRERIIPVRAELAAEIEAHRLDCAKATPTTRICAGIFPRQRTCKLRPNGLRVDLAKAGVPVRDALGRVLDYHSFRKTFSTWAQASGVPQAATQSLLGHTTAEMTARHYTDAEAMDLGKHTSALPWISPASDGAIDGTAEKALWELIENACFKDGGRHRTRTCDPIRVKDVL